MKFGFLIWNFFYNGKPLNPGNLILENNHGNLLPSLLQSVGNVMGGLEASFDEAHHFSDEKIKQFFEGLHLLCAGHNDNL